MEFNYIINPKTGRKISIYGGIGKNVLKNYITFLRGGRRIESQKKRIGRCNPWKKIKCPKNFKCNYINRTTGWGFCINDYTKAEKKCGEEIFLKNKCCKQRPRKKDWRWVKGNADPNGFCIKKSKKSKKSKKKKN